MLRTIAAEMRHALTKYSTRPVSPNNSRSRSTFKRWHSFSSLPRQSDFLNEGLTSGSRHARRPYTRHKASNEAGTGSLQPDHHRHPHHQHQQTIINNIAHHTLPSPYQPKFTNNDKLFSAFPDTTRNRILSLDRALSSLTRLGQTLPVRPENSGNLLTAFAQLSTAKSVFICVGANTAQALFKFIEEAMTERLKEAGITRTMPILDPNEFQAEALIDWFRENKPVPRSDYSDLPPFSVQSTKPVIDLAAEVRQMLGENVPITRIRLDNEVSDLAAPLSRAKASVAKTTPPDAPDHKPV